MRVWGASPLRFHCVQHGQVQLSREIFNDTTNELNQMQGVRLRQIRRRQKGGTRFEKYLGSMKEKHADLTDL